MLKAFLAGSPSLLEILSFSLTSNESIKLAYLKKTSNCQLKVFFSIGITLEDITYKEFQT